MDRARTSLDQGCFETALRAVYEVLALDPERAEARELEAIAKSRLDAQRAHERARRSAYERLESARRLASDRKFEEATDIIRSVVAPSDTVRRATAETLANVQKLQRDANNAAILARARTAFEQRRYAD